MIPLALSIRPRRMLGALAVFALAAACGTAQLGATDANLASARVGATQGADLYGAHCASCHGARGEGTGRAPAVLGVGALPVYPSDHSRATNSAFADPQSQEEESRARPAGAPSREPFRTAADLQRYLAAEMPLPKEKVGTLTAEEYWSLVTFMLIAHGVDVPEGGANAANGATVPLRR